jgi:hypothetical protein
LVALIAALFAGCSSQSSAPPKPAPVGQKPDLIFPAPAGVIAITSPQVNASMWILAGNNSIKTLTMVDAITGKIQRRLPVSSQATDVVQTAPGTLIVGLRTATTGALDLINPVSGFATVSIPVAAPVLKLASSVNGALLYVLEGTSKARAVSIYNVNAKRLIKSIPVDKRAVAVEALPDGSGIWVLLQNGKVDEISLATNEVLTTFTTGGNASALAASPDGMTLYVLRPVEQVSTVPGFGSNVARVKLATQQVTHVLPAPGHCVDIAISTGGQLLYDAVGTATFGNIQVYSLAG